MKLDGLGSAAVAMKSSLMFLDGAISFPKGGGSSIPGKEIVVMSDPNINNVTSFNVSNLNFYDLNQPPPFGAVGVAAAIMSDDVWLLGGSIDEVEWDYGHLLKSWSDDTTLSLLPVFAGTNQVSLFTNGTWQTDTPNAPWQGRYFHAATSISSSSSLYILGGADSNAASQYRLELLNDIWQYAQSTPSPSPSSTSRHNTCSVGSILVPAGCVTFGIVASMIVVAIVYIAAAIVMHVRSESTEPLNTRSSTRQAVMRLLESDGASHPDDGSVLDDRDDEDEKMVEDEKVDVVVDDSFTPQRRRYKRRHSHGSGVSSSRRKQKQLDFDARLGQEFTPNWVIGAEKIDMQDEIGRGTSGCVYKGILLL